MKPALRAVEQPEEQKAEKTTCAECKRKSKEIRELQRQIDRLKSAIQRESYTYESPRVHGRQR